MDLLKENVENRFASNTRNLKGNLVGFKQIKQAVKPLSDVKNILAENNCLSQNKAQLKSNVEVINKVEEEEEYGYDDLCFYSEETEDHYWDITEKALQLNEKDIRSLASVFDRKDLATPSVLKQKFEMLPLEYMYVERDDLLDSSSLDSFDLSDDIFEIENQLVF